MPATAYRLICPAWVDQDKVLQGLVRQDWIKAVASRLSTSDDSSRAHR